MINKMKRIFLMGAMVLGVSFFTSNCALFDPAQNGPSCEYSYTCTDLIDTDAAALDDFIYNCTGTYSDTGCDLTTFDVAGHCEWSLYGYNEAIWFSSIYYTASYAELLCAYYGDWVDNTIF
jgi:hypothetical protein